jgi:GNAT superfamily N-acetyltransferase
LCLNLIQGKLINFVLTVIFLLALFFQIKIAALYDNEKMVAVIGFMPMITLYNGRFIWVCDLVTDLENRSKGYGELLLNYVHNWSKENGYDIVSLSSGLQRIDAHRFYENKMEYDKVSYVFLKRL